MLQRRLFKQADLMDDIRGRVQEALARVRAQDLQELQEEITRSGGDLEIDSKQAEVVISMLEVQLDRTLAKVEDLRPEQLATVEALTSIIATSLLN
jgi:acyl carrier protein